MAKGAKIAKRRLWVAPGRLCRSRVLRLLDLNAELVGLEVAHAAPDFEAREDVGQVEAVVDDGGGLGGGLSSLRVGDEVVQIEGLLVEGGAGDVADDRPPLELL